MGIFAWIAVGYTGRTKKIGRSPRGYRRKSADQPMASKIDINQELKEGDYYTEQSLINASIQM